MLIRAICLDSKLKADFLLNNTDFSLKFTQKSRMIHINNIIIMTNWSESESLRTAAENWLNLKFADDGRMDECGGMTNKKQ